MRDWANESSGLAGVYGLYFFLWLSWVFPSFQVSCDCFDFCCREVDVGSSEMNLGYLLICFVFQILFFPQHASFLFGDKKKLVTMTPMIFLQPFCRLQSPSHHTYSRHERPLSSNSLPLHRGIENGMGVKELCTLYEGNIKRLLFLIGYLILSISFFQSVAA